jgi:beta-mannosidase
MYKMSLSGAWQFSPAAKDDWLPAQVPGEVHTDLMAAGRIPDPFVADNELRVLWVAEADWVYRRTFDVEPGLLEADQVQLVCDGLNTFATATLNGVVIGRSENMYRQFRWEVKPLLKAAGNELVIAFDSTVRYITEQQAQREMAGVSQAIPGSPHSRTAPCQFGWDWGPELPPMGIWKDIRLEAYSQARLTDVHLRQRHENGAVIVSALVTVDAWTTGTLLSRIEIAQPDGPLLAVEREIENGQALLEIQVEKPQLWWPNGYGEQPLYEIEVTLHDGSQALDRQAFRLGLRTIELRQEPDQWGRSFTFIINGVPILRKAPTGSRLIRSQLASPTAKCTIY